MNLHFFSVIISFLSSVLTMLSLSFSDLYNRIRTAALNNISPLAAAGILALMVLLCAVWFSGKGVLLKEVRESEKE